MKRQHGVRLAKYRIVRVSSKNKASPCSARRSLNLVLAAFGLEAQVAFSQSIILSLRVSVWKKCLLRRFKIDGEPKNNIKMRCLGSGRKIFGAGGDEHKVVERWMIEWYVMLCMYVLSCVETAPR